MVIMTKNRSSQGMNVDIVLTSVVLYLFAEACTTCR